METMKQKVQALRDQMEDQREDVSLFQGLFRQGYLATNENGEVNVVTNPDEQQRIAESFAQEDELPEEQMAPEHRIY